MITKETIYCRPGTPYLTRWCLRTRWFGVYVHRFEESDIPVMHDHPWNFVSIVLRGGYAEYRPGHTDPCNRWFTVDDRTVRRAGSVAFRRAEQLHHVQLIRQPTWTLIIHGPKRKEWGFIVNGKWVHWLEYHETRGAA